MAVVCSLVQRCSFLYQIGLHTDTPDVEQQKERSEFLHFRVKMGAETHDKTTRRRYVTYNTYKETSPLVYIMTLFDKPLDLLDVTIPCCVPNIFSWHEFRVFFCFCFCFWISQIVNSSSWKPAPERSFVAENYREGPGKTRLLQSWFSWRIVLCAGSPQK